MDALASVTELQYLQLYHFALFCRLSFPSGHSSFSAYTMIYLAVSITYVMNVVWVDLHFPDVITRNVTCCCM